MTSCGIEYEHNFAIVDFGKKPNYEIILGRPFMRQLRMIQDWGYNYIYLRQPGATTRVDLRNHSYKDVLGTPIRDMISAEGDEDQDTIPSWLVHVDPLGLRGVGSSKEGSLSGDEKAYIPEPFPKHEFEPHGWHDILATLDVCANVHATKHCDDEGYDIMSAYMVSVIHDPNEGELVSSDYDKEIILEGPEMDSSRISTTATEVSSSQIPLMPMKMEITSIEDLSSSSSSEKDSRNVRRWKVRREKKQKDKEDGEFHDASDEFPSEKETKEKKPTRRQKIMEK